MLLFPDDASTGSYSTYNYWPPTVQGGGWYDWQQARFQNPCGPSTRPCPPPPPTSPNPNLFLPGPGPSSAPPPPHTDTSCVPGAPPTSPNPTSCVPGATAPPPPPHSDSSCVPGATAPPPPPHSDSSCVPGATAPPRKNKNEDSSEMAKIFLDRMEPEIKGGEKKAKSLKVRKMPAPGQGAGKKKICLKDGNLKHYIINQLENLKRTNDKNLRTLAETIYNWSE